MWEIYAYGNDASIQQVLNGIVAIMGGSDYLGLLRTVGLVALIITVVAGLFQGRLHSLQWLIGLAMVYLGLFVPKVDVIIIDRLDGSRAAATVSNVPLGFAFFASSTSRIGDYLTRSFETVFTIPGDLKYQGNGPLFGGKILRRTLKADTRDTQLKKMLNNYVRNCVYYDILDGRYTLNSLTQSSNAWVTISNTNPGRMTSDITGNTIVSCSVAQQDLNTRLVGTVNEISEYLGQRMYPRLTAAAAAGQYQLALANGYQYLVGVSRSASDTILHHFMMNMIADSGYTTSQQMNDPAMAQLALATAQAQVTTEMGLRTTANIVEESLPLVRNVIEVVVISVFPFVFLMFLLPPRAAGAALKAYGMTLMWIQLWPPLYAVLNLVTTMAMASQTTKYGFSGGPVLSNVTDLYNTVISTQAIAGYMVVAIPLMAYALVKGGEVAMASIAGSVVSPQQSAGAQAGQAVGTGNLSYGNLSFANQNAFNSSMLKTHNAPSFERPDVFTETGAGVTTRVGRPGGGVDIQGLPVSSDDIKQFTSTARESARQNQTAGLQRLAAVEEGRRSSTTSGGRSQVALSTEQQRAADTLIALRNTLSHSSGSQQSRTTTASASVGGELHAGVGGGRAGAGIKISGGRGRQHATVHSDNHARAQDVVRANGYRDVQSFMQRAEQSGYFDKLSSHDKHGTEGARATYDQGVSRERAIDQATSNSQAFKQDLLVPVINKWASEIQAANGGDQIKTSEALQNITQDIRKNGASGAYGQELQRRINEYAESNGLNQPHAQRAQQIEAIQPQNYHNANAGQIRSQINRLQLPTNEKETEAGSRVNKARDELNTPGVAIALQKGTHEQTQNRIQEHEKQVGEETRYSGDKARSFVIAGGDIKDAKRNLQNEVQGLKDLFNVGKNDEDKK
jgi:conjugal transfer mating pair stabilization protein TraG